MGSWRRQPTSAQGLLGLAVLGAACAAPAAEQVALAPSPAPAVVEPSQPSSAPSTRPSSADLPSSTVEYPRDERCSGLLATVDEVHEAPHDVDLPEPYELIYETEVAEGEEDVLGEQQRWTITVWPRLHEDDEELVFTILHEVAHLYDNACLGNEGRAAWMEERGLPRPWHTGDPFDSPDEDFADAWAVCQGADPGEWRTSVGGPPTPRECSLVQQ